MFKIAYDDYTARMVEFIIRTLWSHRRLTCRHNKYLQPFGACTFYPLQLHVFEHCSQRKETKICAKATLVEWRCSDIWTFGRFKGHWFAGQLSWGESGLKFFTAAEWVKSEYITRAEYIVGSIISHLPAFKVMQNIFLCFIHCSVEISINDHVTQT